MDDLISRERLLRIARYNRIAVEDEIRESDRKYGIVLLDNIIRCIENLPTAYNVDKVVEQIRENSYNSGYKPPITKISTNKAIEIVKAGGVNEN